MIVYVQTFDYRFVISDESGNILNTFETNDYDGMVKYLKENRYRLSSCSSIYIPSLMA